MRCNKLVSTVTVAMVMAVAAGGAVAQPSDDRDRGWWRGPWQMWDDDWEMMGRGMMGPGMMGMIGPRMMMPMMLVMMDTNGDGAVSFEEMEAVHKRMFDIVDENKDGKVTPEEMRAVMGGRPDDN
jgi:hypothetical protein